VRRLRTPTTKRKRPAPLAPPSRRLRLGCAVQTQPHEAVRSRVIVGCRVSREQPGACALGSPPPPVRAGSEERTRRT
jgi:hypothetical protein